MSKAINLSGKTWTKEEEQELLTLCSGSPNLKECFQLFADDRGRTYSSALSKYYELLRKQRGTTKSHLTQAQPDAVNHGARGRKNWSGEDDRNLMRYLQEGRKLTEMEDLLHRTGPAIHARISRLRKKQPQPTATERRTSIQDYIASHPELLPQAETVAPQEALTPVSEIHTLEILKGSIIRIPIAGMNIESTPSGNNLVIQL
jgi:hypothetical protein